MFFKAHIKLIELCCPKKDGGFAAHQYASHTYIVSTVERHHLHHISRLQEAGPGNWMLLICVCTQQYVPKAASTLRKQRFLSVMMKSRVSYALSMSVAQILMPFFFLRSLQHSECGGWSWGCVELPLCLQGVFANGNMEDGMQKLLRVGL